MSFDNLSFGLALLAGLQVHLDEGCGVGSPGRSARSQAGCRPAPHASSPPTGSNTPGLKTQSRSPGERP